MENVNVNTINGKSGQTWTTLTSADTIVVFFRGRDEYLFVSSVSKFNADS